MTLQAPAPWQNCATAANADTHRDGWSLCHADLVQSDIPNATREQCISSSCHVFTPLHGSGPAVTCQIWQIGTATSFQPGRELDSLPVGLWCESHLHSAFGFPLQWTHRLKLQVSAARFLSRIWRGQRSSVCWSQRHEAWWCRPIPCLISATESLTQTVLRWKVAPSQAFQRFWDFHPRKLWSEYVMHL